MSRHGGKPAAGFREMGLREEMYIRPHLSSVGGTDQAGVRVLATIDTGAQITMVRSAIAIDAGLKLLDQEVINHFAGPVLTNIYLAQISCGCGEHWRPIKVCDDGAIEHPLDLEIPEMLLGLDVLRYATLCVDGPQGSWTLEFDFEQWPTDVESLSNAVGSKGDLR